MSGHGHGPRDLGEAPPDFVAGHVSLRTYYIIFVSLMLLMGATVGAYYLEQAVEMPGWLGITIAMGIATLKTVLIVMYFMHVQVSSKLVKLFAGGSFVFLMILFIITMGDYTARDWPPPLDGPLP